MMVAAVSGAASTDPPNLQIQQVNDSHDDTHINPGRPPLLPSEKDNKGQNPRRPKSRIVSSRYMSPSPSPSASTSTSNSSSVSSNSSSSRRFPSPLVSRNSSTVANSPALVPKRSVSADRRRHVSAAARPLKSDLDAKLSNGNEPSAATRLLVTATRSLSVSFQGESFSLPISKTKAAPPTPNLSSVRKGTPERRRSGTPVRGKIDGGGDQVENSKPIDQHRWPGRTREANPTSRSLGGSVGERNRLTGPGNVIRSLQHSMIDERRPSVDARLDHDCSIAGVPNSRQYAPDDNSLHNQSSNASDLTASDTDSVSSGSTTGMHECGGTSRPKSGPRGIAVSARFWQETNSRLRRLQDPGSPLSTSPGSRLIVPPKLKKFPIEGPVLSPRAMSSPVIGAARAASPSKLMPSSPSRGMSPSRVRNAVSTISSNFGETPSVLSFAVDVRRSKVGENRIADAHSLRLLYNRQMQWRFVNARTESVSLVQNHSVEKDLWNAWITISELRDAVTKKRHRLQLIRQKLKLAAILKGQVTCLEDWASLEKDHSISLLGANEALKASTLRLPIVGGAIADIQSLKEAIGSAIDVMQATASSIFSSQKIDEVNAMMTELAKVAAKEQVMIKQCKDFLAMVAAIQVKDCSLRTHILQYNRLSSNLT